MTPRFEIRLSSGIGIYMVSLNQSRTYEGLLEGLPTTEMNQRKIAGAIQQASNQYGINQPYLIQPIETPVKYSREGKYPFGNPASIPGVLCQAEFRSFQPARDKSKFYSWLTIIWFQDQFALPIAPEVLEQIKAIDWVQFANDDDY